MGFASETRARLFSGRFANLAAAALGARAFVVGRRVFLSREGAQAVARRTPEGLALLVHELTHVEQYARLGIPRFLLGYFSEYLAARGRGLSHAQAYAGIAFEREAEDRAAALLSPEGSRGGLPPGA